MAKSIIGSEKTIKLVDEKSSNLNEEQERKTEGSRVKKPLNKSYLLPKK